MEKNSDALERLFAALVALDSKMTKMESKIDKKIDAIDVQIHDMKDLSAERAEKTALYNGKVAKILERNTINIEEHIRRTELLEKAFTEMDKRGEESYRSLDERVDKIEHSSNAVFISIGVLKWVGTIVAGLIGIGATIYGIFK